MSHTNGHHKKSYQNGSNGSHKANGSNGFNGFKPVIIHPPQINEEEKYQLAYTLVQHIDATLTAGTQHYRTRSGQLLRTLDEVVNAILADNLVWEGANTTSWDQDLARAA